MGGMLLVLGLTGTTSKKLNLKAGVFFFINKHERPQ